MTTQSLLRHLLVALIIFVLSFASYWYRPTVVHNGQWLRCSYAPIQRQLLALISVGAAVLLVLIWSKSDWRTLSLRGQWLLFTLLPLGMSILWVHTLECWARVIEFNEQELRVRRLLGSRIQTDWSKVSRLERTNTWDAFRVHLSDGRHFAVPDSLVGQSEFLSCAVRCLPFERYFGARRALDRVILRLQPEVERAVERALAVGFGGFDRLGSPDEVVAVLALSLGEVFESGLHRYYGSSRGNLAARLPRALSAVGAPAAAALIAEANLLFGAEGPAVDPEARQAALDAGAGVLFQRLRRLDEQLAELRINFDTLLRAYIDACGEALAKAR